MVKACLLALTVIGALCAETLSSQQFRAIGKACIPQSDRPIVTAIVQTESSFNPYALSINYPARVAQQLGLPSGRVYLLHQPQRKDQAVRWAKMLLAEGRTLSIGLMQVSTESSEPVEDLLDPCRNLKDGWKIFLEKYAIARKSARNDQEALRMAISQYNTGSVTAGVSNGYVARVMGNLR